MNSLMTSGYCVIPDWLNSLELAACLENLELAKEWSRANGSANGNYSVMADQRPHPIYDKIVEELAHIRSMTDLVTDTARRNAIYFDTEMYKFPWHQDHEPYFQYWDNYNLLTFWIPLIKPSPELAGLTVIPMDKLEARVGSAMYKERFLGKGAKLFTQVDGRTHVKDDYKGDVFWLDFDIEELAVTPVMKPGDLLIFRCDVIHRSQAGGHRASMGVRTHNSQAWVNRKDIYECSPTQYVMMKRNPGGYQRIYAAFERNPGVERLRVSDI